MLSRVALHLFCTAPVEISVSGDSFRKYNRDLDEHIFTIAWDMSLPVFQHTCVLFCNFVFPGYNTPYGFLEVWTVRIYKYESESHKHFQTGRLALVGKKYCVSRYEQIKINYESDANDKYGVY